MPVLVQLLLGDPDRRPARSAASRSRRRSRRCARPRPPASAGDVHVRQLQQVSRGRRRCCEAMIDEAIRPAVLRPVRRPGGAPARVSSSSSAGPAASRCSSASSRSRPQTLLGGAQDSEPPASATPRSCGCAASTGSAATSRTSSASRRHGASRPRAPGDAARARTRRRVVLRPDADPGHRAVRRVPARGADHRAEPRSVRRHDVRRGGTRRCRRRGCRSCSPRAIASSSAGRPSD